MVFYLIILLAVSIVGMLALISAKRYELTSGNLIFANSRPRLAKFSQRMVFLFGTAVPLYLRWQAGRLYRASTAWVHRAVAHGAVRVEHWLERTLQNVREKTASTRAPGEASAFLREVGEYKKKLTDGSSENRIDQE
jgi:hypothetical protein